MPPEVAISSADPLLGAARRRAGRPAALGRLRAQDLKARGDECVRRGNHRDAWEAYSKCLALGRDACRDDSSGGDGGGESRKGGAVPMEALVYSNRSLAYCKAGRYHEALADADAALALHDSWPKAHFRRGAALCGLRRGVEAVDAHAEALRLSPDESGGAGAECEAALWSAVQKLTREQVAGRVVDWVHEAEEGGAIEPPELEAVSRQEMVEALFREYHEASKDKPSPHKHYHDLLRYAKGALDADLAMAALGARDGPRWAEAWYRRGEACAASHGHPDLDWGGAVKAYTRAVDLDPDNGQYQEALRFAGGSLGPEQMSKVLNECYAEMGEAKRAAMGGILEELRAASVARVEAMCCFVAARARDFSAKARDAFRGALSKRAGVGKLKVVIERVKPVRPKGLDVHFTVLTEAGMEAAQTLLAELKGEGEGSLAAVLASAKGAGGELLRGLGAIEAEVLGRVVDATPDRPPPGDDVDLGVTWEPRRVDGSRERSVYFPARPKLDMELPYRMYTLVRHDGAAVERTNQLSFKMSRVYHHATELKERVYVEIMDGSLRWTQTGDSIEVIVLGVPPGMNASELDVRIEARELSVRHRATGDVYLEGRLWRAVVPEDSTWTVSDADEPGVITMYLRKMNLELLAQFWELSHSWWEKLFDHHAPIQWDDYDKDYSDIPREVREHHARQEAIGERPKHLEWNDKQVKEKEHFREDIRKREKFLRLERLGAGHWSYVHYDPLAPIYDGRSDKQRKSVWLPGVPPGEREGEYYSPNACPSDKSFIVNAADYQQTNIVTLGRELGLTGGDEDEFTRARAAVEATYRFNLEDGAQTAVTGAFGHASEDQMYEAHIAEAEAAMADRGLDSKVLQKARRAIEEKKREVARATVGGAVMAFDEDFGDCGDEDEGAGDGDGQIYEVDDAGNRLDDAGNRLHA